MIAIKLCVEPISKSKHLSFFGRHPGESRDPAWEKTDKNWVPAFAGMTKIERIYRCVDVEIGLHQCRAGLSRR
jgi:hypothetical protein